MSNPFGHFDENELDELEQDANQLGLTTTAFHYGADDSAFPDRFSEHTWDLSWVNAHLPGQDPEHGEYEINATDSDELRWKMGNWAEWNHHPPLLLGSSDDSLGV